MGLLGGWLMVAAIVVVAGFLIREVFKYMSGEVVLTARQKVVRPLGGAMLLGVLLMIALLPRLVGQAPAPVQLIYLLGSLLVAVLAVLMAILDAGELSRQYLQQHRSLRQGTITPEDIDRLARDDPKARKDHPEDIGRT